MFEVVGAQTDLSSSGRRSVPFRAAIGGTMVLGQTLAEQFLLGIAEEFEAKLVDESNLARRDSSAG
jgi:hypothetical protein